MKLSLIKKKNKKGSTFEGWTEGIVFSVLFVIVLGGVVFTGMNNTHDGDLQIEGLDTDDVQTTFENLQKSQQEKIDGGDATFQSDSGLTLSTSWDMVKSILSMVIGFLGGGWVEALVSYMHLPAIVGLIIRGLWIVALGFVILGILFNKKV
jgi:hypothetical protein